MAYISKRTGEEVDALLDKVEKGDFTITIDTELSDNSDNAIANSTVTKALKSKVEQSEFTRTVRDISTSIALKPDKEGYYPEMSVGMADNLVGRGDVQDAQINFRPSGGDPEIGGMNITDGAARIERIKGNSVVYNQWWQTSYKFINVIRTTISYEGSIVTISANGVSQYALGKFTTGSKLKLAPSHKFYISVEGNLNGSMRFGVYQGGAETSLPLFVGTGEKQVFEGISSSTDATREVGGALLGESDSVVFDTSTLKLIDLTQMFGADNEPKSYEEYLLRKPMNIEDEYACNAGTLVDMKVDSLISTSDNAYDYENGYARVMGGVPYTITVDNLKDITPEEVVFATKAEALADDVIYPNADGTYTFPSNGYANASFMGAEIGKKDTICICLKHSYDKPHPPYQQEVKDLSFISEAFPNGMRSAGSAYDEIRFNPTAQRWEKVVRVGVREYVDGDAENSSVTTDGETTNYPLANPTPTTIPLSPNLNLDYHVWDFGTEEAMASVPSAPLRAVINYEPNAVDDLRWAVAEIRKLKEQLAQMQASETNLTE